jgi:hypothetical protein
MKDVSDKIVEKIKTHFMFRFFSNIVPFFGKRLSRKSNNAVVFEFAFHIAVQISLDLEEGKELGMQLEC